LARVDNLITNFKKHLEIPFRSGLPMSQRVWFLVYPPEDERRVRAHSIAFEQAALSAGHIWKRVGLGGSFVRWMDELFDPEERAACLAEPQIVEEYADPGYRDFVIDVIEKSISEIPESEAENCILAIDGLLDLFDFVQVSSVIEGIDTSFPGVIAVFFPGEREGNTYRFIGARTGWDYLAVPILSEKQI
jgi:hypothetical protein